MNRDLVPEFAFALPCLRSGALLFALVLLLAPACTVPAYAADDGIEYKAPRNEDDDDVSYRFLGSGDKGGEDRGDFGYDEIEGDADLKVIPTETAEELRRREKIRNVLRLVEGDSVQVSSGIRVKMIGVDAPEYKGDQGRRSYQIFAAQAKKWLKEFMEDPFTAMGKYEGMDTQVNYKDRSGEEFTYYYLYMPDQLLEDIRKEELNEYDLWLKEKAQKLSDANAKAKKNQAEITGMGIEDLEGGKAGGPQGKREYMIKEQLYYHEDGSLKKEEILRDGKPMIVRQYDRQGNLIDEVFYDTRMRPQKKN